MMTEIQVQFRAHIEREVTLTNEEFDFLYTHFTAKKFHKHQYLVQEGNYVSHDYYIAQGLAKSSSTDDTGKEHILQFAMGDSWITDLQAFQHGTKATLDINCLEDSIALLITLENREKLCSDLGKMEKFFRKKTTEESINLQRRILCLISNNARDRYEDLLQKYPGILQRVSKAMIASYLGVSRETLSRLALT